MIPTTLDQNLLCRLDRGRIAGSRVGECECQFAVVDAKLPAARGLFGIGTCQNYAVRLLGVFGLEGSQLRTQPESYGEWLVSFNVADIRQIQPGGCVHSHVRPEPYSLAPDHRTLSCRNILQLGSRRRVDEGHPLLFVETQAHLQSCTAYRQRS